ncbi:LysM peptidoglycan-binding domain-containing protein [Flavobacterium sp.]|uniref:LysM peptidoglycan-binding domain-containing protein n=1 Tax=Flavobacterium sp. TaxID=239 RepID=UPI00260E54BA|nr:LysM peptidoglycan-binding domain-containing protein [Flavobacterium sp.]MDD3005347.1 SGNH/GDSL hydrolase family protein [Flavobacterium sp.]
MNKIFFTIGFLLIFTTVKAQIIDSVDVEIDSVLVDTTTINTVEMALINPDALICFYEKLAQIETEAAQTVNQKVNIVHIGDSHIQADLMTNTVREKLQEQFGNAGRGLVFPYNLAKTNGPWDVRFSSNGSFLNFRNVSPLSSANIGLSGILLQTKNKEFAIEINAKEPDNYFNTIKIITPNNEASFHLATAKKEVIFESEVPRSIVHKIKSGDVLGSIANKYNVSIVALKKANGLKSNNIRAGKTLKIPTNEKQKRSVSRAEFIPLEIQKDAFSHFYSSDDLLDKIYLIPNNAFTEFELNGLVLENNTNGILYHSIGVNGAKYSDYNKYPLFFEQLKALHPDVLVLSFGTNESFDHMKTEDFIAQLDLFISNARKANPFVEIIVSTPPPSLFKRKYRNNFVADYSEKIIELAFSRRVAVWDLYTDMGGLKGVNVNAKAGIIGKDKVHYSKLGYEKQGKLLAKAITEGFQNYKISKVTINE